MKILYLNLVYFFIVSILSISTTYSQIRQSVQSFLKGISSISKNENSNLYLSEETYWVKDDTGWYINASIDYKYDENGNNVEEIDSSYYSNQVEITNRFYDDKNRLIDEIILQDNYDKLDTVGRHIYLYGKKLNSEIIYEGSDLHESDLINYYYDSNDNLIEEIDSSWSYEYKYVYSNDNSGKRINRKDYDFYNQQWEYLGQDSLFYNQKDSLIKINRYDQQNFLWLIANIQFNNLSKEENVFTYNENENKMIESARWVYNYNADSTLKEELTFEIRDGLLEADTKREFTYAPLSQLITEVKSVNIPVTFYLSQNYPNPFNPTTKIEYTIPQRSIVTLKVYDILGKEVTTLVNEEKSAGSYGVKFEGNNLSSGIYFYKLQAGNYSSVKKMVLIK